MNISLDFFFNIVFNANERPFLLVVFHTNKGLWLNKNSSINYYKITQEKFEWYTLNLSDIVKLSGKISVWQAIHQIKVICGGRLNRGSSIYHNRFFPVHKIM